MQLEFTPLEFETLCWAVKFNLTLRLEFTPLEFETHSNARPIFGDWIRIYSVGVWNEHLSYPEASKLCELEFTPLEFETIFLQTCQRQKLGLEFTPLEFETKSKIYLQSYQYH